MRTGIGSGVLYISRGPTSKQYRTEGDGRVSVWEGEQGGMKKKHPLIRNVQGYGRSYGEGHRMDSRRRVNSDMILDVQHM